MAKLILALFVALAFVALAFAQDDLYSCGGHGTVCSSDADCCGEITCNKVVNRCLVKIPLDELLRQREKILKKLGLDAN